MSVLCSIKGQIAALVHDEAAASPAERVRHEAFIATRLALSLAAIAILPPYLAWRGLPAPWEAIAFGWLLVPLMAVLLVSRTGRLAEAEALCLASLMGLVVTIAAGGGATGLALAWLIIVPFEAAVAARLSLVLAGSIAALAVAAGYVAASAFAPHGGQQVVPASTAAAFIIPGVVYAAALALGFQRSSETSRRAEQADEARYRALSETLSDVVLGLDRSGAVTFAGREAQALFGLAQHELAGRGLFEHIHVADRPAFLKAVADASDSTGMVTVTLRVRRAAGDGGQIDFDEPVFTWVEMHVRRTAEAPADGPDGIVALARDVTSYKQHEQDLEAARADAERNNAWKDRFLANVSHELRTPLNAIIGFAEMLASNDLAPKDPAKQREYAQIIHTSGEHLLAVVNTILDMSKIESGSFDILPEPFDVAPLIEACCDMIRLKAEKANVRIVRDCAPALPELVADKRACKQILLNLLSNAVKFTPADGSITVGARPEGGSLVLFVNDTGIGITARDLPRIGDPFFQAHGSYDRQYEGTGLGLSVVRGLVGLHGGSISIESAPDAGTVVSVRLPLDCRHASGSPRAVARIDTMHRQNPADRAIPDNSVAMVKKIA